MNFPDEIEKHIETLRSRAEETMPSNIVQTIRRQDEMNLALWEIALQLSKLVYLKEIIK